MSLPRAGQKKVKDHVFTSTSPKSIVYYNESHAQLVELYKEQKGSSTSSSCSIGKYSAALTNNAIAYLRGRGFCRIVVGGPNGPLSRRREKLITTTTRLQVLSAGEADTSLSHTSPTDLEAARRNGSLATLKDYLTSTSTEPSNGSKDGSVSKRWQQFEILHDRYLESTSSRQLNQDGVRLLQSSYHQGKNPTRLHGCISL